MFVSSFILPHHSLVLFIRCLVHRALNTLHGNVHGNNLHARHDNGQHPGATSSLVKNPLKNFFITIVPTTISIKTKTVMGHGDRRGGESGMYLISCQLVYALSLSNFIVIMLLQLHRYEEEEWGNARVHERGNTRE